MADKADRIKPATFGIASRAFRNYDAPNVRPISRRQIERFANRSARSTKNPDGLPEVAMKLRLKNAVMAAAILVAVSQTLSAQQIGKYVPVAAGSDADHAVTEINAATEPAQKLALIDKFAAGPGQGEMALFANELYVNYYLAQKQYDQAFDYGDKIFAIDPGNFQNAVNMIRAASEKGDAEKLLGYGEKAQSILAAYKSSPAPANTSAENWEQLKTRTLEGNQDNVRYIEQAVYGGVYQTPDPAKRADRLLHFAKLFPDSTYALPALGVAASSYQQAQNAPKMLEVANALLGKDPNNLGMLLLVSDYYGEKGEQLDKAESYAQKAAKLADSSTRPENMPEDQWKQQTALQKGLALSTLGQVNLQKKNNAQAVQNFQAAGPLLKSNDTSYARNAYRMGFALINLKKMPEAKAAFTEAASVNSPYKGPAQDKLKSLSAAPAARRKAT
jgi:tetratricopeptide (TPR) repeat protein